MARAQYACAILDVHTELSRRLKAPSLGALRHLPSSRILSGASSVTAAHTVHTYLPLLLHIYFPWLLRHTPRLLRADRRAQRLHAMMHHAVPSDTIIGPEVECVGALKFVESGGPVSRRIDSGQPLNGYSMVNDLSGRSTAVNGLLWYSALYK
jgi:hypothetical protein